MLVWCGPGLAVLYNDAFMALAGDRHLAAIGAPGEAAFPEIWPAVEPGLRQVLDGGMAARVVDQLLVTNRRGVPEETYWTCSSSPIRGEDGTVLGVLTAADDTTEHVVGARRLDTLRTLGEVSAARMTTADDVAVAALRALSANPSDLPFAALCLDTGTDTQTGTGRTGDGERALRLAASYGLSADTPLLDAAADPDQALRRALHTGEPVFVTGLRAHVAGGGEAGQDTAPDVVPDRAPDRAVVLPLVAAGSAAPPGALVLGTGALRPLDEAYRSFLHLVGREVSAAVGDAIAVRCRCDDTGHVSARTVRSRHAEEELSRFRALAERFGDLIAFAAADGSVTYLNPAGRRVIGAPEDGPLPLLSLSDLVAPEGRARFAAEALPACERAGTWSGPVEFVDGTGTRIPVRLSLVAHLDACGRLAFYSTVAEDLRERQRADHALFDERERYRTLVAQAPVGIWVADRRGTTTFVNEQVAALWGRTAGELAGTAWVDGVHPEDRAATAAAWTAAVRDGTPWGHAYRLEAADGSVRHVRSSARPLRGADGALTGFLGTTVDVTDERRAEAVRRDVATEHAARRVSDAAAARLRAMVQGLAAIVWEAEWDPRRRALRFTFVSDRAEELLGHPARRWREDPDFWPRVVHPEDREHTMAYTADRSAAGVDHDITYRAVAIDGRVVWLHQVVHVVHDPDGRPQRMQGLTVDVTEQKRAERSAAVLAETGRLVTDEGTAEERLAALAHLVVHDMGDGAIVSMAGPDGRLRRTAVAHHDPEVERALLAIGPTRLPPVLTAAFAPGLPVLVPITPELNRTSARDDADAAARERLGASNSLVVPLRIGDRVVGLLSFLNFDAPRYYHPSELDLAGELGRRASLMLAADRQRTRERQLQQVSADLASAGSVAEAARLLVARLGDILGAEAIGVYLVEPERGIKLAHADGYPGAVLDAYSALRFDDPDPIAAAVRTGEPVWIRDRAQWARDWPELVHHAVADEWHAAATLPLPAAGRVVGTVAICFPTEREFPADEQGFVLALVAQAAPAFERAATADERRLIAETLQTSLLPPTLPRLERLALASRYLPGAHGTQAGGDWYDVLPLDGGRVAIAVGDVVGQGAKAAAIMGQLRSALSGYLLEGHGPVRALEHLDRFACRVPGAAGSTVACMVLEPETGELTWARAGHPPPIVTGPGGARLLEGATGTVLAVRGRPPFTAGTDRIDAGDSIVLYTDGLVERRGEIIDTGIQRLVDAATRHHALAPVALTDALLDGALGSGAGGWSSGAASTPDPADDVAIIVARLVPAPLRLVLPAEAPMLRKLRVSLITWTAAVGLDEDDSYDLQLAVGEAAANAVEHAYRDGPAGTMAVELRHDAGGAVRARVRDEGSWRPAPDDKGYRGRGLDLIRDVSSRMELDRGPAGTEVRFTLSPFWAPTAAPPAPGANAPAEVQVDGAQGEVGVTVVGDLDLAGVQAVRDRLVDAVSGTTGVVTIDLRETGYLASAGIALLVEVDRVARVSGGRLRLLVSAGDVVRRALRLSGVDGVLEVLDHPGG